MMITGCDFHTRYQQIAMVDEATGELVERRSGAPCFSSGFGRVRHLRSLGLASEFQGARLPRLRDAVPIARLRDSGSKARRLGFLDPTEYSDG
jgi:hypothetical protein